MININIRGVLLCSQEACKIMLKQKSGAIVNVASISGTSCCGSSVVYGITKAAVVTITKHFAAKAGPAVRVNAVAPGLTTTDIVQSVPEKRKKIYRDKTILQKNASPEEIANTIVFLASPRASHTTGELVVIDGGFSIK
jgi:3-oxoacyl-[acyl-carrier protein] reductase